MQPPFSIKTLLIPPNTAIIAFFPLKQPQEVFYKNAVHMKTPVFESLFRPEPVLKRDSNSCFPANIAKFLKTPISKNFCERLLQFCENISLSEDLERGNIQPNGP